MYYPNHPNHATLYPDKNNRKKSFISDEKYFLNKTTGRKAQEDIENEQIPDTIQI